MSRDETIRVLLGVDLRTTGHGWLIAQAVRFAARIEGRIDLLFIAGPRAGESEIAGLQQRLAELLDLVPEEQRGEPKVVPGNPAELLVEMSREYSALVVGPREPGALERMFLGPMATRVIRRAWCPVLIPRIELRSDDEPRRLMVGVDLHRGPEWVIDESARWAGLVGGKLDLIYVEPKFSGYIPDAKIRAQAEREWEATREPERKQVRELLQRIPEEHRGEARFGAGEPGAVLVAFAGEGYDLVLVGTRERPGMARYVLGAVASQVVRCSRSRRRHISLTRTVDRREG